MSDSAVSLELTPESEHLLKGWGEDKTKLVSDTITDWLYRINVWALRETMRAFDESQQTGGTRWLPNRGLYAQWKGTFGSNKPGILSGALRGSFIIGSANNVSKTDKATNTVVMGSALPYASSFYHGQKGRRIFTAHGSGSRSATFAVNGTPPRHYFPHKGVAEPHARRLFEDLLKHRMNRGA